MNQKIVITGFLVVCLIAGIFAAGCTSKNAGPAEQTPAPQPSVTSVQPTETVNAQAIASEGLVSETTDQGLIADDAGSLASQAEVLNATQDTTLTPDSVDLGDIMP